MTQERVLGASELQLQSSATATAEAGAAAGGVTGVHTTREVLRTAVSTTAWPEPSMSTKPICALASSCAEPASVRWGRPFVLNTESVSFSLSTAVSKGNGWSPCQRNREGKPHGVASSSWVTLSNYGGAPQAEDGIPGHFKWRDAQAQRSSRSRGVSRSGSQAAPTSVQLATPGRGFLALQAKGTGRPRSAGAALPLHKPRPRHAEAPSEAPGASRAHSSYICPTPHLLALSVLLRVSI